VFILPLHLDYTKVIILILWWRNFQLEYWRTFQLVSTAFGNESFARGMKGIRPLNDGEKIYSFGAGGYGTKDGIERLFKFYEDMEARIKNECDPQEVYCYEYNNHECCIAFDGDIEAIRLVAGIWGVETAKTIKRRSAFYRVEELFN
ncbi:hypothetical protein DXA04_20685, partial [Phocaeicola vulgatus]